MFKWRKIFYLTDWVDKHIAKITALGAPRLNTMNNGISQLDARIVELANKFDDQEEEGINTRGTVFADGDIMGSEVRDTADNILSDKTECVELVKAHMTNELTYKDAKFTYAKLMEWVSNARYYPYVRWGSQIFTLASYTNDKVIFESVNPTLEKVAYSIISVTPNGETDISVTTSATILLDGIDKESLETSIASIGSGLAQLRAETAKKLEVVNYIFDGSTLFDMSGSVLKYNSLYSACSDNRKEVIIRHSLDDTPCMVFTLSGLKPYVSFISICGTNTSGEMKAAVLKIYADRGGNCNVITIDKSLVSMDDLDEIKENLYKSYELEFVYDTVKRKGNIYFDGNKMTFDELSVLDFERSNYYFVNGGLKYSYSRLNMSDKTLIFAANNNFYGDVEECFIIINEGSDGYAEATMEFNTVAGKEYVDEKISQTNEALSDNSRNISLLWKLQRGQTAQFEKITSQAKEVTVPQGAISADVHMIGGMSKRGVNICGDANVLYPCYIPKGTLLTISCKKDKSVNVQLFLYNADGTQNDNWGLYNDSTLRTITVASDTYFISGNYSVYKKDGVSDFMVNIGSSALPYEPYTPNLIDSPVDELASKSVNTLNPINKVDGRILNDSGVEVADTTGYYYKQYSNVHGYQYVYFAYDGGYTHRAYFFDASKNLISRVVIGDTKKVAIPSNAYYATLQGSIYDTYEMMSIVESKYVPHELSKVIIPQSIIDRCPDYGIGVAGAWSNEINIVDKIYNHLGVKVDLGSLAWSRTDNGMFHSRTLENLKYKGDDMICDMYANENAWDISNDMCISGDGNNGRIYIRNSNYTDADAFKSAMNGVMLNYKLATPEVIDLSDLITDSFANQLKTLEVEAGGTLEFNYPQSDIYDVAVPSTIEFCEKISEVEL